MILQRFKDGGLAGVRVFKKSDGLTWLDSARRTGRIVLKGFPRSNSLGPAF